MSNVFTEEPIYGGLLKEWGHMPGTFAPRASPCP